MKILKTHHESVAALCDDESLTNHQKIQILYQWKYDALEHETEEDMDADLPSRLDEILEALRQLRGTPHYRYKFSKTA